MTPADCAFVGLAVLWILIVLLDNEHCCRMCGAPMSECNCPSSL